MYRFRHKKWVKAVSLYIFVSMKIKDLCAEERPREKMLAMGVHSDLHTRATRPHCFQRYASPGTGSYTYMDRIWEFLTAKGYNR